MTSDGDDGEGRSVQLANPYLAAAGRPAVWGVTLGGVGLAAAAGVLAVAAPVGAPVPDGAPLAAASLAGATEVVLGAATDVEIEIRAMCMPSGYLWPGEPPRDDAPVSPALA